MRASLHKICSARFSMHCPCTRHVVRCVTFYASFGSRAASAFSDLAPRGAAPRSISGRVFEAGLA
eukprot:4604672-Prymnesium_polylepis.1